MTIAFIHLAVWMAAFYAATNFGMERRLRLPAAFGIAAIASGSFGVALCPFVGRYAGIVGSGTVLVGSLILLTFCLLTVVWQRGRRTQSVSPRH